MPLQGQGRVLDGRRAQEEPGTAGRKALTIPITRAADAPTTQSHMRATIGAGQSERNITFPRITIAAAENPRVPSAPIAAPSRRPLAQAIGKKTTHTASTGEAYMRNEKSTNPNLEKPWVVQLGAALRTTTTPG